VTRLTVTRSLRPGHSGKTGAQKTASSRLAKRVPAWVVPYVGIALFVFAAAPLAHLIAPYDPTRQSLALRLAPPSFPGGMDGAHLLGTDGLGRDVLSRVLFGLRASLLVGVIGMAIGGLIGSAAGIVGGYRGGWLDEVLMTVGDIQLSFPFVLLAIGVVAILGPSITNLVMVVGVSGWVTYARVARSAVLRLKSEDFVLGVRAIGGTDRRILGRHILPNFVPMLIVLATLDMPRLILLESTLSFLGLGIQPPMPSLGGMVNEGRVHIEQAWWTAVFPGLAILVTTVSINRIGDWLRALLDPSLRVSA
jgi:peptide/nickel transport system permease protein